jgi:hypothetical protein
MDILHFVSTTLPNLLKDKKIYVYDGEHIKAVAFIEGCKDNQINEVKDMVRECGYEYDYNYECYLKQDRGMNGAYRKEKDQFLETIINWKLLNVKQ